MLRMAPSQAALGALCGALSLVLVWQLIAPVGAVEIPDTDAPYSAPDPGAMPMASAPSSASFADIDVRPLFSPLRKPIASKDDAATGNAAPFPSDLSLVGVIIDGDSRMALIKTGAGAFAGAASVGNVIEGWTLQEIDPDKIVLASGGRSQAIALASNRAPQSSNAAPAGAPIQTNPAPKADDAQQSGDQSSAQTSQQQ